MMAPKLRFSRGLKAKAPGAVTACGPAIPACSDAARRNFYRPVDHDWHKKQRWGRWRFFFFTFEGLSSVWLLFYQRSDTALLLGISPDSWLAMFHSQRCSYICTDDPSTKASGNIHNAVSRHLDKNRAKHRRTVFSMKKAQKSKQRSTNWRRRHLGDMQQQPRRWPGFDKCVETNWDGTYIYVLGHRDGRFCDVYIRPVAVNWLTDSQYKQCENYRFFGILGRNECAGPWGDWGKGGKPVHEVPVAASNM